MDIKNYTLVELRQLAKEKGAKNVSKMKKDELISFLSDFESNEETIMIDNEENNAKVLHYIVIQKKK